MVQSNKIDRAAIEARLHQTIAALEARDGLALAAGLHPDICFIWLHHRFEGYDQVQAAINAQLASWERVFCHVRHSLIDVTHQTAAVEWICRYTKNHGGPYQELLGGTVLEFAGDGRICYCRTYLDPVRSRAIPALDIDWPEAGWSPCREPGPPPDRAFKEHLLGTYARAWSSHDIEQLNQIMHDEICLCPPWDYRNGRQEAELGARVYFDNYRDTQVTQTRFIIDPTQPYFGVCEQTFACTNPETGRRGVDSDFAFFEVAQGKLRYWRTYFDTGNSVQVIEKTAGFLEGKEDKL
jgi:hypothetical protein